MSIPVGLQVYSIRDDAQKDFAAAMRAVKEMGYDFVELAGLYGMRPEEIRRILDGCGLYALSAHVPFVELAGDIARAAEDYAAIGCRYVAIPYLTEDLRPREPGFEQVLNAIPTFAQELGKKGITLLYHNHDFEFVRMDDGSYALDYLYARFTPAQLQTELDTCWVKVAGEDPAAYIRKYAGRCPVVHLKDFFKEGKPADMYELIGIDAEKKKEAAGIFEFRPVGHGMQDVPAILSAAAESGAEYFIVEQDSSAVRPPMEAVRMSREYLKTLGV
ncbi:MAG: sugar phosphate isomerase/epimerase [Provencibacterium sp.]|nr:sugar phosphate isomerase/epimerase [Provencibacterium sp.]